MDTVRKAWRDFVKEQKCDLAITFNFNREISIQSATDKVGAFLARMDRHFLGRGWFRKPADQRVFLLAIPEHLDSNLHIHAVAKLPDGKIESFLGIARQTWTDLVSSGDIHIATIYDQQGWAQYMTKGIYDDRVQQGAFVSTQFHTR